MLLAAVIDRRRPQRENPVFLANLVKQALAALPDKEQVRKNLEKEFCTLFLTQSRIESHTLVLDILISDNPVEMSCSERFGKHIDIFQHHSGTLPFADIVQLVDGTGDKQDTGHFHAQIGMIRDNPGQIIPDKAGKRRKSSLRKFLIRRTQNNYLEVVDGISGLDKTVVTVPAIGNQRIHQCLEGNFVRNRFCLLGMGIMPERFLAVGKRRQEALKLLGRNLRSTQVNHPYG